MSEERSFEVVDRRRIGREESRAPDEPAGEVDDPAEAPAADASAEPPFSAEELLRQMAQFSPLLISVHEILKETLGILNEKAWICMGLRANPATGEVKSDLAEAKRAIDVIKDLARHLDAASPEERRALQTLQTDLNVNYVRQLGSQG